MRNSFGNEGALMEYSEKVIYELQALLRVKVGDYVPVLKKAMDIEEFLYRKALYDHGLDGNLWESSDAINTYVKSLENVKKAIKTKDDFGKIYQIADIRQFYLQLTPVNKKKVFRRSHLFLLIQENDSSSAQSVKKERSSKPKSKIAQPTTKRKPKSGTKGAPSIPVPPPSISTFSHLNQFLPQSSLSIADHTDSPPVLKPELPDDQIEQDDDFMGFGLDFEDTVESSAMRNMSAWDTISSMVPTDTEKTTIHESWSDAAEERRSQQKLSANMEQHRASQKVAQVFRSFLLL